MVIIGEFVPNDRVTDGFVVALVGGDIVWAGPAQFTPLEQFVEETKIHVHPALLERIRSNAEQREPGGCGHYDPGSN